MCHKIDNCNIASAYFLDFLELHLTLWKKCPPSLQQMKEPLRVCALAGASFWSHTKGSSIPPGSTQPHTKPNSGVHFIHIQCNSCHLYLYEKGFSDVITFPRTNYKNVCYENWVPPSPKKHHKTDLTSQYQALFLVFLSMYFCRFIFCLFVILSFCLLRCWRQLARF